MRQSDTQQSFESATLTFMKEVSTDPHTLVTPFNHFCERGPDFEGIASISKSVSDFYLQLQGLSGLSTLAFLGLFKTVVVDLNRMYVLTQDWQLAKATLGMG